MQGGVVMEKITKRMQEKEASLANSQGSNSSNQSVGARHEPVYEPVFYGFLKLLFLCHIVLFSTNHPFAFSQAMTMGMMTEYYHFIFTTLVKYLELCALNFLVLLTLVNRIYSFSGCYSSCLLGGDKDKYLTHW